MLLNDRPIAGAIYYRTDDHPVLRFRRKAKRGLVKIEEGKPLTFFVLADDYSSKGIWVHPVGVHFIKGKRIACSEEEKVPAPCFICERIRDMRAGGSEVFPYPRLVEKRDERSDQGGGNTSCVSRTHESRRGYIQDFDDGIKNDINIFEPSKSTAYNLTRSRDLYVGNV
jgi:hypothetical protein